MKVPLPKHYFPLLDISRLAAAMGVIWRHVAGDHRLEWSKELGRFAVPFFVGSAIYFAMEAADRHPDMTVGHYMAFRFKRIYLLFLVWSVIYWLCRSFSSIYVEHTGVIHVSVVDFLWNGVALQLWFLPFILLVTIASFLIVKIIQKMPALRWPALVIFALAALEIALNPAPLIILHGGYSLGLGYRTLPCCCAVLAFRLGQNQTPGKTQVRPAVDLLKLFTGIFLFACWLAISLIRGPSLAPENVAGFGLLLFSLSWQMDATLAWTAALGSVSFGIYLIHPLFVEGMQHILPKLGFGAHSTRLEVFIFFSSALASFVSVKILRSRKLTRWLTG